VEGNALWILDRMAQLTAAYISANELVALVNAPLWASYPGIKAASGHAHLSNEHMWFPVQYVAGTGKQQMQVNMLLNSSTLYSSEQQIRAPHWTGLLLCSFSATLKWDASAFACSLELLFSGYAGETVAFANVWCFAMLETRLYLDNALVVTEQDVVQNPATGRPVSVMVFSYALE
jgi:hypothetical protein